MKRVWTERWKVCKSRRKNYNKESRVKLTEDRAMKLCSEKLMKRENKKGGRQWLVNNRQWGNSRRLQERDRNWKEFWKITSRKRKRMKIISEGWSMRFLKRKENLLVLLKSYPGRAISMRKSSFSWSKKLIRREESHWPTSKRFRKWNKSSIPAANKLKKRSECLATNFRRKGEKVWLTKREPKIFRESLTKKFISLINLPEENPKIKENCNSWKTRLRKKETRVWLIRLPSGSLKISWKKRPDILMSILRQGKDLMMRFNSWGTWLKMREERAWLMKERSENFKEFLTRESSKPMSRIERFKSTMRRVTEIIRR